MLPIGERVASFAAAARAELPDGPPTADGCAAGDAELAALVAQLPGPPAIGSEEAWTERMFDALRIGLEPLEWLELCFAELFGYEPRFSWRRYGRRVDRALARIDRYGELSGLPGYEGLRWATEVLRARAEQARCYGQPERAPASLAWLVPVLEAYSKDVRRWFGRTAGDRAARRGALPRTVERRCEKRRGRPEEPPADNH